MAQAATTFNNKATPPAPAPHNSFVSGGIIFVLFMFIFDLFPLPELEYKKALPKER